MSKREARGVVVTGGVRGQGPYEAGHLANADATVVAVDMRKPAKPFPLGIIVKNLDVTSREEWGALGDALKAEYRNVFGIVDSHEVAGPLENVTLENWSKLLEANTTGYFSQAGLAVKTANLWFATHHRCRKGSLA